jgi:hypothetical protein
MVKAKMVKKVSAIYNNGKVKTAATRDTRGQATTATKNASPSKSWQNKIKG